MKQLKEVLGTSPIVIFSSLFLHSCFLFQEIKHLMYLNSRVSYLTVTYTRAILCGKGSPVQQEQMNNVTTNAHLPIYF